MAVSIAIVLDTRRAKKRNLYPVKLRVTFDRKSEHYSTIYDLTQEDYHKFPAPRVTDELQKIRTVLQEAEKKAITFAQGVNPFNFDHFEKEFINKTPVFKERKAKTKNANAVYKVQEQTQETADQFDF